MGIWQRGRRPLQSYEARRPRMGPDLQGVGDDRGYHHRQASLRFLSLALQVHRLLYKKAPWKRGQGDVVREVADACKEYGLKFGVYLSPWDRNHADYGKPEYITYFRNQLTELLTRYGPVFEVWFDGANGGTGYYGGANEERKIDSKTYYDWPNIYALVRKLQPKIVIWNDGEDRGDLRWVGTESGFVGETNWSQLNAKGDVTWPMLHFGLEGGDSWVPAEVNTSIRPEWFYHPIEDGKVKTVPQLLDAYYNSIGRNGTFLLNFPIRPDGTIHPTDVKRAVEMGEVVKRTFAVNLASKAKAEAPNTRGGSQKFGPQNALDEKKDTSQRSSYEENRPVRLSICSSWARRRSQLTPSFAWLGGTCRNLPSVVEAVMSSESLLIVARSLVVKIGESEKNRARVAKR